MVTERNCKISIYDGNYKTEEIISSVYICYSIGLFQFTVYSLQVHDKLQCIFTKQSVSIDTLFNQIN